MQVSAHTYKIHVYFSLTLSTLHNSRQGIFFFFLIKKNGNTQHAAYKFQNNMKACLNNFDPLKPHFYIVKLGFTGVYIIFLFLLKNKDCGYSLELPQRGGSNEYPQSRFEQKYENYQNFLSENFQILVVKISVYLNRRVFIMRQHFEIFISYYT